MQNAQNSNNSSNSINLKETEIGLVPEEWEVKKIGSFAKFQGGYAFKSTDYQSEGVPLFKISNVSFGETDWNEKSYLPYSYLSEYSQFELKPGDLVMAMTRPIVSGGIKIARLSDSDCPCLLNQRVGRFIVNQDVDVDFLFQILFDQSFISSISYGALGSQQPNISANKIEQISIPLPPLCIQQKIASILSTADKKIEAEETQKKNLDGLFKSLLHNLMTGKVRVNHIEVML